MASSYNELFGLGSHSEDAALEGWWPLQDNAASTAVDDVSSNNNNGTLAGGDNTADITTTGPNNWLTAALDLDGTADYITAGAVTLSSACSVLARVNTSTNATQQVFDFRDAGGDGVILRDQSTFTTGFINSGFDQQTSTSIEDGSWHDISLLYSGSSLSVYTDGVTVTPVSFSESIAVAAGTLYIGRRSLVAADFFDGLLADIAVFSRGLSASEEAEWRAGPEPINTVAPALSGTELVGETLTATSGTWALDDPFSGGSNGTVMPSYQWTRSDDDAGTGEADITDATNSTYVLTASDAGKYVRCRVRGANDGGFDANADTNTAMSGQIATTTLLANLDLHYKLDETSGTVMRNEVRTLVNDNPELTGTGGTSENGTAPDDWTQLTAGAGEGSATSVSTAADGSWVAELTNGGGGSVQTELRQTTTVTIGVRYTCEVRWRLLSEVVGTPNLNSYIGATVKHADLENYEVADGWQVTLVDLGAATTTTADLVIVQCASLNDYAHVEIDSITIYQENAGTYVNSPMLNQPGQIGRAVAYSSGTDHATIPNHDALKLGAGLADFSISLWLKTSSSSLQHIVSNYAGVNSSFELLMHTSGTPYFIGRDAGGVRQWNPTSSLATPFNDGDWHNILLTFEFGGTAGATVKYYLDGALDYSAALPSWTPTYASALGYMAQRYDAVNPFVGTLDDVRLYSRLLDATDVYAVYSGALSDPNEFDSMAIGLGIGL